MDQVKNSRLRTYYNFTMRYVGRYWWVGVFVVLMGLGAWKFWPKESQVYLSPEAPWIVVEKPLEKYSFVSLRERVFVGSEIKKERILFKTDNYTAWLFSYLVDGKKVTGQMNIPKTVGTDPTVFPVVVMLRGFVDQEIYETGVGTKNGASYFAGKGYVTLAPDFLGFGESDMPPNNVFEERFLRPVQVLELIASVKKMEGSDPSDIQIWGHSNGGQLALSVLEIGGFNYPTSLWAPVTKPFPYSILYFTDEFDDYGKALRKVLAGLEALYDVEEYDIMSHLDWIEAPIQIHQGTADDAVPLGWSLEFSEQLKLLDKKVELYQYTGADHNLVAGSDASAWSLAMERSLEWFEK